MNKRMSIKLLTVSITTLALSLGCPSNTGPPPETKTAPTWSNNPSLDSSVKGEFSVTQGRAEGTTPIQYAYYWKTSSGTAPQSSDASAWSNAGWTSIAQNQLSEPVRGIKEGGTIYLYAVASNSEGFDIAGPFTAAVEKPVAPAVWGVEPAASDANGVLAITTQGEAKGHSTAEPPVEIDMDPLGDYAYYYAESDSAQPPLEGADSPADWVAAQWNSIQPVEKKLALEPGEYAVYAVVVNNGGSLRFQIKKSASEDFFTISSQSPVWTAQPAVKSGEGHGVFTLKSGGLVEGNPKPTEIKYYFADPLESLPDPADIGSPDAWTSTSSGLMWTAIDVGQTLDFTDSKNIKPGATDYQLYGVATNSEGVTLSDKIPVLIKGLSAWENQPVTKNLYPTYLANSAAIVVNGELYVIAGRNGATYTSEVWHAAYNEATKKWTWQKNTNTPGFGTLAQHMLATDGSNIYVLGGKSGAGVAYNNKVWKGTPTPSAANPANITWSELTSTASKWSPRVDASVAFFNNNLYLMGGEDSNGRKLNDVWKSEDGADWTRIKTNAEWDARYRAALVPHDNKMWLLGGFAGARLNDVWTSDDGVTWTEVSEKATWTARENLNAVSYQEKIWVLGGKEFSGEGKDVWFSSDGLQWYEADDLDVLSQVGFAGVLADGIVAYDFTKAYIDVAKWITGAVNP